MREVVTISMSTFCEDASMHVEASLATKHVDGHSLATQLSDPGYPLNNTIVL